MPGDFYPPSGTFGAVSEFMEREITRLTAENARLSAALAAPAGAEARRDVLIEDVKRLALEHGRAMAHEATEDEPAFFKSNREAVQKAFVAMFSAIDRLAAPAAPAHPAAEPSDDARDAARYRWLRDVAIYRSDPVPFICGPRDLALYGEDADAAIDALLAAAPQPPKEPA